MGAYSILLNGELKYESPKGYTQDYIDTVKRLKKATKKGDILVTKEDDRLIGRFVRRYDTLYEDMHRINRMDISLSYGRNMFAGSPQFTQFWAYVREACVKAGIPEVPAPKPITELPNGIAMGQYPIGNNDENVSWAFSRTTQTYQVSGHPEVLTAEHGEAMKQAAERFMNDFPAEGQRIAVEYTHVDYMA